MKIVVTGLIAQFPFGGVIWDYIHYILSFQALGHEVWYLEDTGTWSYDQTAQTYTDNCDKNVQHLRNIMDQFGMTDRWIYRNGANGQFFGRPEAQARDLMKNCDLVVNVSGAAILNDYDHGSSHLMFLDGDPMFTQLEMLNPERPEVSARIKSHHSHFSFGLNIGQADCLVPTVGLTWKRTVQPIALDRWQVSSAVPRHGYTTVMNWASYAAKEWQGRTFGQKDMEFEHFLDLPSRSQRSFALAMGQGPGHHRPTESLQRRGWIIYEPEVVVADHLSYHRFLSESWAEWSIAKHGYVQSNSGWFSCRTACYLAAGRPAVVQETGWSQTIPSGHGVLSFRTMEECLEQINRLESDYAHHRRAARALVEEHFSAEKVCAKLLTDSGLS